MFHRANVFSLWMVPCLALGMAWAGRAEAVTIDLKLPYNIAYDLAPIEINLGGGPGAYHIYDVYKTEVAKGEVTGGAQTITFTPPRYGWYLVAFGDTAKFIGVTPKFPGVHTLVAGEMTPGWNDEALQAFSGLMCDRTNSHYRGFDGALKLLDLANKYGVTLLMQFENPGTCTPDHVRQAVTAFKGKFKYYEIMNEPNFSMGPDKYAALVKELAALIKSIDPEAKVMGPDTCGIDLGWHDAFYKAGGGQAIDILSIHDYEGDEAIDPFHWMWKLGELRKIMAAHGDAAKPIWQTERALGGVRAKVFLGPCQAVRLTLERDLMEIYGVSNDHNSHYYADVTGYSDVPTFVYSPSGPQPAALACRTRQAMTLALGRKFVEKLDFGPTGNKMFLGLLYTGASGSTVTLRNLGTNDLPLELGVTGGGSVEVVDSFGNARKVPVQGGKAKLAVSQFPIYLNLAAGQKVTAPVVDFGKNIAAEATFAYSAETKSNPAILTDGIMQVWHNQNPWGPCWLGAYPGTKFNESPQTLDITFPGPRDIAGLAVFGARADNPHCALLDYDVQYQDGKDWVTLEEVRAACPRSDALKTYICETVTWYLDNNFYVNRFAKPVKTDKLRLIVRRISFGFMADLEASQAAGFAPSGKQLELREIEVYSAMPSPPRK